MATLLPDRTPMSHIPETRQSLFLELGKRSEDAWAEFLLIYEDAILRLCRSKGLQDADALDVTQEVLAVVHERVPTWDHNAEQGSFRAWILRVARNISVDSIHARARQVQAGGDSSLQDAMLQLPVEVTHQSAEFDLEYARSLFDWAAAKVQSEVRTSTWQAFHLTAIQGLGAAEVAQRLGLSIGNVYTSKCRVVAHIREQVAKFEADP